MYSFLCVFLIYAFLGWCTEVAYAALVTGKFVNRGFLNGPVCPIYGFGVILVAGCLTPLKDNALLLFAGSVALTSALEWLAGFVLEKLFHQRWWDYSDEPFNLGGYICLRFSIGWGVACLLVMEVIHPAVLALIRWTPQGLGMAVLCAAGAVMAVDLTATVKGILKMNEHLKQIDELAARIREGSDELGESLTERVLELRGRGEDLKEELDERREDLLEDLDGLREDMRELREELDEARQDWRQERREELEQLRGKLDKLLARRDSTERRLLRAFPRMQSRRYREAMERWKRRGRDSDGT